MTTAVSDSIPLRDQPVGQVVVRFPVQQRYLVSQNMYICTFKKYINSGPPSAFADQTAMHRQSKNCIQTGMHTKTSRPQEGCVTARMFSETR